MKKQGIYLITDGGYLRKRAGLIPAVQGALEGAEGCIKFVQLREQNAQAAQQAGIAPATDAEVLELAAALKPLCEKHSAKLLINRRIDLAKRSDCDGVHLGKGGPSLEEARDSLGADAIIGYSAHSIVELKRLEEMSYSYALLSPIFRPFSKNVQIQPLGVKQLHEACSQISFPVFALGGITKENTPICLKAGAAGVATITSVLLAPNPAREAKALAQICCC